MGDNNRISKTIEGFDKLQDSLQQESENGLQAGFGNRLLNLSYLCNHLSISPVSQPLT
jgi:hypothetical protein